MVDTTTPTVESDKSDNLPKMQSIEEQIARYGQMTMWLGRMASQAKDPKIKNQLKIMVQLSIEEFASETEGLVKIAKTLRRDSDMEDKLVEDELLARRGQRFKFLETEKEEDRRWE